MAPVGATHFLIKAAGALSDFEAEKFELDVQETEMNPIDPNITTGILDCNVTAGSTKPYYSL